MIDAHYIIRAVIPYSGIFQREGGKQKGKETKKKQASFLYSNVLTIVIKAQRNVKVKSK